jgi:hypothetical protein
MPGKKVAILQSNYIPWKGYLDIVGMVDEFIIYDEVQYTKNDWRNRNKIKTPQGVQWITIPVYQKSLSQKINETEVADAKWAARNWNTIRTNYSRAPFFKTFSGTFEEFYRTTTMKNLSAINVFLLRLVCEQLGIRTKIRDSSDFSLSGDPTQRLVQVCQQANANVYLSGPSARNYLEEEYFQQANIAIEWMDYSGYPEYPQQFPPFSHQVSIIDLIFNTGPDSPGYMKFSQL